MNIPTKKHEEYLEYMKNICNKNNSDYGSGLFDQKILDDLGIKFEE